MKIFIKIAFIFLFLTNIAFAELLKPNKKLKPIDVLTIQLNSLKNNNIPYKNAGIEQTWEFAHPENKKFTGPLEKFKRMIYSENYQVLLNFKEYKITNLSKSNNIYIYKINILSKEKKEYYFIWKIEKVIDNESLKNCWMTSAVMHPEFLGENI